MKPTRPRSLKDQFPIEIAWLQLARRRIPPISDAQGTADAEPALRKIETIANRSSNAVEGVPTDPSGIYPALEDAVLKQPSDVIFRESSANGGAQPETAAQAPRHIVLATAFPHIEMPRGADPAFTGIQAQHDL